MTTMASQITSLTVVYSTVYSDVDQRKHQSSASLAFVRGIHRDRWIPRTKGQLRGKCFHLMTSSYMAALSCICGHNFLILALYTVYNSTCYALTMFTNIQVFCENEMITYQITIGVTKDLFVNFSVKKSFNLAKVLVRFLQSHSYLTGVTVAELLRHLPNTWWRQQMEAFSA